MKMVLLNSYHRHIMCDQIPEAVMSADHGRREPELNIGNVTKKILPG